MYCVFDFQCVCLIAEIFILKLCDMLRHEKVFHDVIILIHFSQPDSA
jgi:hypothetical protein